VARINAGVYNGTAPNPVRMTEFCNAVGNALGRPSWLPVPDFALNALLGEGSESAIFHTSKGGNRCAVGGRRAEGVPC